MFFITKIKNGFEVIQVQGNKPQISNLIGSLDGNDYFIPVVTYIPRKINDITKTN